MVFHIITKSNAVNLTIDTSPPLHVVWVSLWKVVEEGMMKKDDGCRVGVWVGHGTTDDEAL